MKLKIYITNNHLKLVAVSENNVSTYSRHGLWRETFNWDDRSGCVVGNVGIKTAMETPIKVSPEIFLKLHNREKALAMTPAGLSQVKEY